MAADASTSAPLRVYGSVASYFTGKLEGYLRYKEIAYERIPMTAADLRRTIPKRTGAAQMPAVELPDGRWMTDTTPMIAWLEEQHPESPVIPSEPLQRFVSLLLEDYADEWLWRPALHYRWSYPADAHLQSRVLADEMMGFIPLPAALKRFVLRTRQRQRYVRGDGVTRSTRLHVEGIYLETLAHLQAILAARPFLLGARPSLADFGFFASMFRHFGLDPTPSAAMRERAPAVYAWLARLWNARASTTRGELLPGVPDDWGPLLASVASAYLPYLAANARAWSRGVRRFDVELEGVAYRGLPASRYRVWCLERLRRHFEVLPAPASARARALLRDHGGGDPLWSGEAPASGHDPEDRAPFARGLEVFRC